MWFVVIDSCEKVTTNLTNARLTTEQFSLYTTPKLCKSAWPSLNLTDDDTLRISETFSNKNVF